MNFVVIFKRKGESNDSPFLFKRLNKLYLKTPAPRKFSRKYFTVSFKVSAGSRVAKFNSLSAFDESKYQKYSAISTAFDSIGDVQFRLLKNESTTAAPEIASFFGNLTRGAETPVNRSSLRKNSTNVQFAAPSRYFSRCLPFSSELINAVAASRASTKFNPPAGVIGIRFAIKSSTTLEELKRSSPLPSNRLGF